MLTIRRACEADCALIRRLADEVFPATYRGIITPSQMEYMMEWMYGAEVLAREMCGEFAWFIASADGEPCGYLSVQHEAEDLFHLQKIYVLPRFQGIGAGEFLFRHAVEYIRSVHPAPCRMELNVNRNNRALRRALLIALLAVVLIGLLILARISYLGRYAVYSPDGVYFDKTQKLQREDVPAAAPAADPEEYPFETILSASSGEEETGPDTVQLQGYYISTTMLANGVDEVRQALQDADGYNAVLIDVKSPLGNFYYSTDIADAQTADADISACDALIRELTETPDLIVVARVPAFSDPNFVAKHYSSALTTTSGDLWMDERRCYWLRPDSIDAQSYLAAIALELDSLGFDEVLFDNFYVPSDSSIAWDTEAITPVAALEDCAENLTANLTGSSIRLALGTSVPSVAQYASRVFVTTERANDVLSVTDAMTEVLPDPATQLVFVTTSHDTRFDASGVIRPLLGDSSGE